MLSRRTFFPTAGLTMAALLSRWPSATAASPRPQGPARRLIVIFAAGGWDLAHALDAKPGSTLVDTPSGTLKNFGSQLEILVDPSRPQVGDYFAQDASLGVLVRGISTQSFIHEQSSQRVLTGAAGIERADLAAQVAADLGSARPIPYLVLGGSGRVGSYGHLASRAGTTNQLASLAGADLPNNDPLGLAGPPGFRPNVAQEELALAYLQARNQAMADQSDDASLYRLHQESLDRANLLRTFAAANNGLGGRGYTPNLATQVDVALQALKDDLCQAIFLQHSGWDTHTNNAAQGQLHDQLFGEVGRLSRALQESGGLADTVVAVISEMGRTPKLNPSQGKDHWPVTAAWLFGAGIRGGRTIGGTDERLMAQSVDFKSGAVNSSGRPLQTPNFAATLLRLCGTSGQGPLAQVEVIDALLH